jgi:hypothetical protein
MVPLIKSGQKHMLAPASFEDVQIGDIAYCKVKGNWYTHIVTAKNDKKGCQISNNQGYVNGWTKAVYGVVIEVVGGKHKRKKQKSKIMSDIKRIDIKEFREKGYLQELNRQFLHPLGLAIEIIVDNDTGEENLGGIWDYREDEEGIYYDVMNSEEDRIVAFKEKKKFISDEFEKRKKVRKEKLGFEIEPLL